MNTIYLLLALIVLLNLAILWVAMKALEVVGLERGMRAEYFKLVEEMLRMKKEGYERDPSQDRLPPPFAIDDAYELAVEKAQSGATEEFARSLNI